MSQLYCGWTMVTMWSKLLRWSTEVLLFVSFAYLQLNERKELRLWEKTLAKSPLKSRLKTSHHDTQ